MEPISVSLQSGFVPWSQNQTALMIHGGAGPQDPKGERAQQAKLSLQKILTQTLDGRRKLASEFPDWFLHVQRGKGTNGAQTDGVGTVGTVGTVGNGKAETPGHSRVENPVALQNFTELALSAGALLERDPLFNAGYGSALQEDGRARLSASYMDNFAKNFSAVINAEGVLHPSLMAYLLQTERFRVLNSEGVAQKAREWSVPFESPVTLERFERWVHLRRESILQQEKRADGKGTIGVVGIDSSGHMLAITSTGGVGNETLGRVGDTPTVAGNYCTDNCAVSCTGYGEQILDLAFATRLALRTEDSGDLESSFQKGLKEAADRGFGLAAIAIQRSAEGFRWAAGTTEGYFVWALGAASENGKVALQTF